MGEEQQTIPFASPQNVISLDGLGAGIYFYHISRNSEIIQSGKLVKE
jgi:hypothetical protein